MTDLAILGSELAMWLRASALPLWWIKGADHVHGGFHEALDLHGHSVVADRRARVQARQIYVYSVAGKVDGNGPWKDAVAHGLAFFLDRYTRPDHLFRTAVEAEGARINDETWLYDQAFALFALAEAARITPDRAGVLAARSHAVRQGLQAWRLPEGGFEEPPAACRRQSNPHMHLLEACLAWETVDADPSWKGLADEIVELCLSRFIDKNGVLHEFFAENWTAAPGLAGKIVEPGHHFEWAWLLERWARRRAREDAHLAARRLFEIGMAWGVRDGRDVAVQQVLDDGSVYDPVARLWPQTEWMKAAIILGETDQAAAAVRALMSYLQAPIAGLWRDKLKPDGAFIEEPAPASSFYHIVCAILELLNHLDVEVKGPNDGAAH